MSDAVADSGDPWAGWAIAAVDATDLKVGETVMVRATHQETGLWQLLLGTVTEGIGEEKGFHLISRIDGSPEIMAAIDEGLKKDFDG